MSTSQRLVPRWFAALVLAAAIARVALAIWNTEPPPPAAQELSPIRWQGPSVARRLAAEEGRPLLLLFTADWCAPCARLEEETLQDDDVIALVNRHFVAARVVQSADARIATAREEELRVEHGVEGFPTLVVMLPDGRRLKRTGYMGPGEARRFLEAGLLDALVARSRGSRGLNASTPPDGPSR